MPRAQYFARGMGSIAALEMAGTIAALEVAGVASAAFTELNNLFRARLEEVGDTIGFLGSTAHSRAPRPISPIVELAAWRIRQSVGQIHGSPSPARKS